MSAACTLMHRIPEPLRLVPPPPPCLQDVGDERSRTEAEFFQYVSQVSGWQVEAARVWVCSLPLLPGVAEASHASHALVVKRRSHRRSRWASRYRRCAAHGTAGVPLLHDRRRR